MVADRQHEKIYIYIERERLLPTILIDRTKSWLTVLAGWAQETNIDIENYSVSCFTCN